MNFPTQLEAAQKICDFIMKEAPRNKEGDLYQPYRGWVNRLDNQIKRGKAWVESESPGAK